MPKIGASKPAQPPRPRPIRLLSPGTPFVLPPPVGTVARGVFLELIGHDAKVLPEGSTHAVCWSGETMVLRDAERPAVALSKPKPPAPSGPSRAERREQRVLVERINARPARTEMPTAITFGSED